MSIKYGNTGLHDGSIDTKVAAFDLQNITAGVPVTITVPNASGTMAYTESGSFTGTFTGFTTTPTATFRYTKVGNQVTISVGSIVSATSNATTKTITGMPSAIFPSTRIQCIAITVDNGASAAASLCYINNTGVIELFSNANGSGFTSSGTASLYAFSVSYSI